MQEKKMDLLRPSPWSLGRLASPYLHSKLRWKHRFPPRGSDPRLLSAREISRLTGEAKQDRTAILTMQNT